MYWCVWCVSMWVYMCHSISVKTRGHLRYQSSSSTLSETKSGVCPVYTRVTGFHAPEGAPVSTSHLPEGVLVTAMHYYWFLLCAGSGELILGSRTCMTFLFFC